jgi:hypothetical protein
LFARPLTVAESVVRLVWLVTVVAKLVDVDTRTLYDVAPAIVPQLRVNEVDWLTALFVGAASVGAPGVEMTVVKLHTLDHALVPPAFVALTSQ